MTTRRSESCIRPEGRMRVETLDTPVSEWGITATNQASGPVMPCWRPFSQDNLGIDSVAESPCQARWSAGSRWPPASGILHHLARDGTLFPGQRR